MAETMKVLGIPVTNINLGSCRTRYFYMLRNLPEGWTFERYCKGAEGDVLYIQKTETSEVWEAVKDCKNRGIPIVYERDDFCKPWNKEHTRIMNAADAVTIISKGLLESVKKHTTTPLYHVPDGFDYEVKREEKAVIRPVLKRIVTFGRHANVEEAGAYFKHVKLKKAYICDRIIKQMKGAKYIAWSLNKFKKKLLKHDLVVIVHAKNFREKYKDVGRSMVAMALGIPVVATANIEIKRVLKDAGHPELIMKKPTDLKKMVKMLQSYDTRKRIADDLHAYAWANWRPDITSKCMAKVFEDVVNAPR
jgi:glycosyltransferase involved in cell wall biosynthesis